MTDTLTPLAHAFADAVEYCETPIDALAAFHARIDAAIAEYDALHLSWEARKSVNFWQEDFETVYGAFCDGILLDTFPTYADADLAADAFLQAQHLGLIDDTRSR